MIVNVGSESGYFFFTDVPHQLYEYCEYVGFTCCDAIEQTIINVRHGLYGDVPAFLSDAGYLRGDLEPIMREAYNEKFVRDDLWYLYEILSEHCWVDNNGCPKLRSVAISNGHVSFKFEWNLAYGTPTHG